RGDSSHDHQTKGDPGGEQPEAKTLHVTFLLSRPVRPAPGGSLRSPGADAAYCFTGRAGSGGRPGNPGSCDRPQESSEPDPDSGLRHAKPEPPKARADAPARRAPTPAHRASDREPVTDRRTPVRRPRLPPR